MHQELIKTQEGYFSMWVADEKKGKWSYLVAGLMMLAVCGMVAYSVWSMII